MTASSQIRESLMRIKQSQSDLLKQLRSQHDALQHYITNQSNEEQFFQHIQPNYSYENSLQLSKSEGNVPGHKNVWCEGSTTGGADEILQNNYRKIEDLLLKQRKLHEQNHALQQQNQSLSDDLAMLKKLYYEGKQNVKNCTNLVNFFMNQVIYRIIKDLLIQVQNNQILNTANISWNKFKVQHSKLFSISNIETFISACQSSLLSIYSLLGQQFKITSLRSKQEQIQELKQHISQLVNMTEQMKSDRKQQQCSQQNRVNELQGTILKLNDKIKNMKIEMQNTQQKSYEQMKKLEQKIIMLNSELKQSKEKSRLKDKEQMQYKQQIAGLKQKVQATSGRLRQIEIEALGSKEQVRLKQQHFFNQIQLQKRQNKVIQNLTNQLILAKKISSEGHNKKSQMQAKLQFQNQSLHRELEGLKKEYNRFSEVSSKQVKSLHNHLNQIKSQHSILLKSQQNARMNQIKFRQLASVKTDRVKLNANIDHLWAVKEIEYENVIKLLASTHYR